MAEDHELIRKVLAREVPRAWKKAFSPQENREPLKNLHLYEDGQLALEHIKTIARDRLGRTLVLTDGQMPNMGGLELAKEIRSLEGGNTVPIVLLTGGVTDSSGRTINTQEELEKLFVSESPFFNGVLVKPYPVEAFVAAIREVVLAHSKPTE